MKPASILLVEQSEREGLDLKITLEFEGHRVAVARCEGGALKTVRSGHPELMVLDSTAEGLDGLSLLQTLRSEGIDVQVLVLLSDSGELNRVRAFRAGADDCMIRPFAMQELLTRVEGLILRDRSRNGTSHDHPGEGSSPSDEVFRFGDAVLDTGTRTLTVRGEEVHVTLKEYDLLLALLSKNGKVATRSELLRTVWQDNGSSASRTLNTHVAELRRKLGDDSRNPEHLLTVWKVGYRLRTHSSGALASSEIGVADGIHSSRSAASGSIRVARRAGR